MPNTTTAYAEHPYTFAVSRQSPLIAALIELTFPADTPDKLRVQELAYQLDELRGRIHGAAQEGCDALLRVSAGLGAVLRLLDADSDSPETAHELHCLLTPLKQQLDNAVDRVQGMI
ncbi:MULTISPECIES: DUF1484 family protein [Cupriavidus]